VSFPPDDVRAQLERILASPGFASADRASRFLRYVVGRTIAGEGDQLKEYVIGREVFDRDDNYDPRIDSIVRVEAGRLRSRIDEYYAGPGRTDGILIQFRRGSYTPAFEPRERESAPGAPGHNGAGLQPRGNRGVWVAAAVVVVVALIAFLARYPGSKDPGLQAPAPTIAVLPFANYSTDQEERMLAARVTDGITAELARLGTLGVVSHTSAQQYADISPRPSLREIAKALDAQFVLEGKVRDETGHISIQVILVDASVDRKIWVHDVGGTQSDIPGMQRQLAQAASAAVLQRKRTP